ncbi:Aste57867_25147 [Aphanomyces stellatus]|uniref:Aste57867_25147 protein n=1 Tax=Aphanomyces stellatus TaxID=120398 RepID=A0A485LTR0_9STRA|nr:hypothetical protein As57867_025069 [Aphanomyces stellatus]VFU01776.1 Aste57867_25147 [Aphanomyces stellatus]
MMLLVVSGRRGTGSHRFLKPAYACAAMSTEKLSPFQTLKQKVLDPFTFGAKELIRENREAWASRSKLQATPGILLSRREMFVLRQAPRDLIKSLPLLIAFAVPLVGYFAPVLGYYYPKWTLPWQFWSADHKAQFFEADVRQKAAFYPDIARRIAAIDTSNTFFQDVAAVYAKDGAATHDKMDPKILPEFNDFFAGPADLSKLPTAHLRVLIRATSASPLVHIYAYLPKTNLVERLERRASEISVDDLLLLQEGGVARLSLQELVFACEERGLVVSSYKNEAACRVALEEWLSMYDEKLPTAHAASLVLHAPILGDFDGDVDEAPVAAA